MAKVMAIILLDEESKLKIKTNVSMLGARGFKFIDSLDEINDENLSLTNKLIILEGFMQSPGCISDIELYKELFDLDLYYLGADDNWLHTMKNFAHCFKCDISLLDFELVQGALFNDKAYEDREAESKLPYFDEAKAIVKDPEGYSVEVVNMANLAMSMFDKAQYLEKRVDSLNKRNSSLETLNAKIKVDRDLLLKGYKQILDEAAKEQDLLKQYENVFTTDVYQKIRLHEYSNRPLVIYFKEYEDFLNLDEFIETLTSVLRLQERKSVKVLRLFDSSTSRKMLTLPDYYKKMFGDYALSDVMINDFLCKSGDYRRILDKLLLNEIGLDVLILIDSKDYNDTILSGISLQMNLCREIDHLSAFHLNEINTIVNTGDPESKYYWGFYDTYDMSDDDKFLYLSSRPVMRNVLDLCNLFEKSV